MLIIYSLLTYAARGWRGFIIVSECQRIDAFLCRSKRCWYYSTYLPLFDALCDSVARYHGTTAAPRYHFSTVPVPSALRYYLVPQYHNYRGSSAWYCPMLTHS